ncbi:TPA: 3-isopropylmalate dehydratase, partial [Pseudomonas aeruginosa]
MRPMYAVAILFLLAGCSSVPAEKTRAIPAERLLGYQQPVSGGGRLEVHRDYGYLGGGCYVAFLIDRQVAARIGVGEEASFQVPAGEHV